mgnify:CR=1 FL=1
MKTKILMIILFFSIIGCVSAGENTISYDDMPIILDDDFDETTIALEDGHLNIMFSNDYNGYCVEYMEQEARKGDKFYITNTSHIKNNNSQKDVGQYLKRYFIDYYNETQNNEIVTQHTIWHFTDDFNGWRINYTIVDNIKNSNNNYDDDGIKRWNNTHNMKYRFRTLLSPYEYHQNYFIYKILFIPIQNETENNTYNPNNILQNIITNLSDSTDKSNIQSNIQYIKNNTKKQLINYYEQKTGKSVVLLETGNPVSLLFISLITLFIYGRKY